MKYPLLTALLTLSEITVKGGLFGGKPFASFTEEQLEQIEKALGKSVEKQDTSALTEQIAQLQKEVKEKNTRLSGIENAVTQALELNGLEKADSFDESIELLGTTCKAYGEKKQVHTALTHNGKEVEIEETLQDGYFDSNAEHNKID